MSYFCKVCATEESWIVSLYFTMSREIMLFSAKQWRNKIWNSMILETLKSNPQISCLQCSLKKLSIERSNVLKRSEIMVTHRWQETCEKKKYLSVMYALCILSKNAMFISVMTNFKIFLSHSGVMGLHIVQTGHICWLAA